MASTMLPNGQPISQAQLPKNLTCPDLTQPWFTDVSRAAVAYCRMGWSVTVLCPPNHFGMSAGHLRRCKNPGKTPWHYWTRCQTLPLTEAEVIELYRQHSQSNVGMALGVPPLNLIRLDVEGSDGESELRRVAGGDLPGSLEFTSGKGRGLIYSGPPGVELKTAIQGISVGQELRLQGLGAQTVLPPSLYPKTSESHRDRYAWQAGRGPGDCPVAALPGWAIQWMLRHATPEAKPDTTAADGGPIPEGRRNDVLFRMGCGARRAGNGHEAILAYLSAVNATRCQPHLTADEVTAIVDSIVKRYHPVNKLPRPLMERDDSAAGIIARFFAKQYPADHKRGTSVYLASGAEVTMADACALPDSELIRRLENASDCPQTKDGEVKPNSLPVLFRNWARVAWGDYLKGVRTEDQASETAGAEFRRLIKAALLSEVTLARTIRRVTKRKRVVREQRIERNSLIGWCEAFAKPGPWRAVRGKQCWCRRDELPGGEVILSVAINHGLMAQVKADRRLLNMSPKTFNACARRYDIGFSTRAERPHGYNAVVLTREFINELTTPPPENISIQSQHPP